jgi:hypothetical protein
MFSAELQIFDIHVKVKNQNKKIAKEEAAK